MRFATCQNDWFEMKTCLDRWETLNMLAGAEWCLIWCSFPRKAVWEKFALRIWKSAYNKRNNKKSNFEIHLYACAATSLCPVLSACAPFRRFFACGTPPEDTSHRLVIVSVTIRSCLKIAREYTFREGISLLLFLKIPRFGVLLPCSSSACGET